MKKYLSGLQVKWQNQIVIVTDWTLDDEYVEAFEATWKTSGTPLNETELEQFNQKAYSELHQEAYINHESACFDRAKDFRKYGE